MVWEFGEEQAEKLLRESTGEGHINAGGLQNGYPGIGNSETKWL